MISQDICTPSGKYLPEQLFDHPLFLMVTVLKLAKQKGFQYRQQQNDGQEELHLIHFAVLSCLSTLGPLSQKEVSELLTADPSDLVAIIDKLESAGYVRRTRDSKDRRRHSLEVTAKGLAILPDIQERSKKFSTMFLAPLSTTEQQQLRDLLFKVISHHTKVRD